MKCGRLNSLPMQSELLQGLGRDGSSWDVRSGKPLWKQAENYTVDTVEFSRTGDLISQTFEGLAVRDTESGGSIRRLDGRGVHAFQIIPNADEVLVELRTISVGPATPSVTSFFPSKQNRFLQIWNLKTGEQGNYIDGITPGRLSPDGRLFLAANSKAFTFFDFATGNLKKSINRPPKWDFVHSLLYSADGSRFIIGQYGRSYLWDGVSGRMIGARPLNWCPQIFSSSGSAFHVLSKTDKAGPLILSDINSGKAVKDFGKLSCAAAISSDGDRAITDSNEIIAPPPGR